MSMLDEIDIAMTWLAVAGATALVIAALVAGVAGVAR